MLLPTKIPIPTLNDEKKDFFFLFELFDLLKKSPTYYHELDFSFCKFLRPNAVAFIGGVIRFFEKKDKTIKILWDTLIPSISASLTQNGFGATFGYCLRKEDPGHAIPYREDVLENADEIINYLVDNWIGKGWVQVSPKLCNHIAGKMWEIYANSFEHSQTPIGVFTCGQHFRHHNELVLSVIDFGVGIPATVKEFLNSDPRAATLPADACLRWAFESGNTTTVGVPRGLGLSLLQEFISVNKGTLELYSSDGYVKMSNDGEVFQNNSHCFNGTVLHITLVCDEKYYLFKDELEGII
ncbi:hypothetical protein [Pantoea agglomerans]|uniref:hypothetical protein n=1 Tax=Enterobacter agglomerans TaxID=549 RepID=UPI003BF60C92